MFPPSSGTAVGSLVTASSTRSGVRFSKNWGDLWGKPLGILRFRFRCFFKTMWTTLNVGCVEIPQGGCTALMVLVLNPWQ